MAQKKATTKRKKSPAKKASKPKGIWLRLSTWGAKAIATLIILGITFLSCVYLGIFGPLPSSKELAHIENNLASEVYTKDGTLMGKYYQQNRMSIENKFISQHAINALIATEDSRFFKHNGYDPISLARVLVRTILMGDTRQGGGSTISQQLAKNLYPRQSYGKLSLAVNKAKEIFIAARLEQVYTKDEVLTLYLNTVPFGENVYGIEAASLRFFDKHSSQLQAKEAAVLIGMLAANTAYNPRLHPEKSTRRRNIVLGRMASQDYITETEEVALKASKLDINYHKFDHNNGIAPYFRNIIKRNALKVLEEKYGDHYDIYTDGLKIYTTIDATMQRYADEAVQQHMMSLQQEFKRHWAKQSPWQNSPETFQRELKQSPHYKTLKAAGKSDAEIKKEMSKLSKMTIFAYPQEREVNLSAMDSISHYLKILNTGFMVMHPSTGEILSWVGGVNHKYFQYDHVTSRRQVGSTFKPIVYTAALQNGMEPCDYISNEQRVYEDYDDWSPSNAGGNHEGYYSMKGGLTHSVNTITAEIMMQTGVDKVLNLAQQMGIESNLPAVPSISLGTGEISLQEMLTAYTCFANDGLRTQPFGLLRIEDSKGNILYQSEAKPEQVQVLDESTAQMMNYMLQGVIDKGTGRSLRSRYHLKSQLAGKTGTTQNNADGWFIAYNPQLLAGVWVGADNPVVHFRTTALGQGAHMALPIYGLFMKKLEANPKYNKYTRAQFKSLPIDDLQDIACADYLEEEPSKNFFDIFKKDKHDLKTDQTIEDKPAKRKEEKEEDKTEKKKKKGIFNWLRKNKN